MNKNTLQLRIASNLVLNFSHAGATVHPGKKISVNRIALTIINIGESRET